MEISKAIIAQATKNNAVLRHAENELRILEEEGNLTNTNISNEVMKLLYVITKNKSFKEDKDAIINIVSQLINFKSLSPLTDDEQYFINDRENENRKINIRDPYLIKEGDKYIYRDSFRCLITHRMEVAEEAGVEEDNRGIAYNVQPIIMGENGVIEGRLVGGIIRDFPFNPKTIYLKSLLVEDGDKNVIYVYQDLLNEYCKYYEPIIEPLPQDIIDQINKEENENSSN